MGFESVARPARKSAKPVSPPSGGAAWQWRIESTLWPGAFQNSPSWCLGPAASPFADDPRRRRGVAATTRSIRVRVAAAAAPRRREVDARDAGRAPVRAEFRRRALPGAVGEEIRDALDLRMKPARAEPSRPRRRAPRRRRDVTPRGAAATASYPQDGAAATATSRSRRLARGVLARGGSLAACLLAAARSRRRAPPRRRAPRAAPPPRPRRPTPRRAARGPCPRTRAAKRRRRPAPAREPRMWPDFRREVQALHEDARRRLVPARPGASVNATCSALDRFWPSRTTTPCARTASRSFATPAASTCRASTPER